MWARIPYWLIYVVLAGAGYGASRLLLPDADVIGDVLVVPDASKAGLEQMRSMVQLVTTLNTTLAAATAAVAVKGHEWSRAWTRVDGALIITIFLSAAISYYGIYVGHIALIEMLQAGGISFSSLKLELAIQLQYYGTLTGFVLLGLVFSRMMEQRRTAAAPSAGDREPHE